MHRLVRAFGPTLEGNFSLDVKILKITFSRQRLGRLANNTLWKISTDARNIVLTFG